uniref:2-C-methyl-D-erythritol 4-phosphate cytidylyltransferase n=1 Tax=Wolbachia endosymbiont of Pentidionis agamae TaxID=3110435 RepID=UPI002FD1D237
MDKYKIIALIVAAGVGSRCNTILPKQYVKLSGNPVLFHTIKKFLTNEFYVKVVINKDHEAFYSEVELLIHDTKLLKPVCGGKSRQESVRLGLESLREENPDYVIIHDACRPFVSNILIDKLVRSMNYDSKSIGVVPVLRVEDTVSLVNDSGLIESTICREEIRAVQTPQIFYFADLLSCHQLANVLFTDDSSLMLANKRYITTIQGEKSNFKLTTEEDMKMAKFFFEKQKFRVGTGYDVHRFIRAQNSSKCFIKICGVEIEHTMKVAAHSDGDVGIHAIVDAILGALGCGDIGEYFSPNSLEWKDCDSCYFLSFAARQIKEMGYIISNIDVTIVCEVPKISPYKVKMKKLLSQVLGVDEECLNIKATTTEKLGS